MARFRCSRVHFMSFNSGNGHDMEKEAERIALELAEYCARWSRGDPHAASALASAIVAKFLEAVERDCASGLYRHATESQEN